MSRLSAPLAAALLTVLAVPAAAQTKPAQPAKPAVQETGGQLPGGASSLQETFDDWTVMCALPGGRKACALSQAQANQQTRQRVLAIELSATDAGMVSGVLLMPFGLALAKGVTLQIDEAPAAVPIPFQTCMPGGCIVPLSFGADVLARLKAGKQLNIGAFAADTGQPVAFTVSLKGFAPALARVQSLL